MDETIESSELKDKKKGILFQILYGVFINNPRFWESFVYVAFVLSFTVVAIGSASNDMFIMGNEIRSTYSSFNSIVKISDWWNFMQNDFVTYTFPNQWYNGLPMSTGEMGMLNSQFLLLGAVGLRQLRVRKNSCQVGHPCMPEFQARIPHAMLTPHRPPNPPP